MYTILYRGCDEVFSSEFLDDIDEWFIDHNVNPIHSDYRVVFDSLDD